MQRTRQTVYMHDELRQENISDPTSIFKKFRMKASKSPVRADGDRTRETIKA